MITTQSGRKGARRKEQSGQTKLAERIATRIAPEPRDNDSIKCLIEVYLTTFFKVARQCPEAQFATDWETIAPGERLLKVG
jgi:hypothetical protein